jgi:hypothetical protein
MQICFNDFKNLRIKNISYCKTIICIFSVSLFIFYFAIWVKIFILFYEAKVRRKKLSLFAKTWWGIFGCKATICPTDKLVIEFSEENWISPSRTCTDIWAFAVCSFNSAFLCKPISTTLIFSDLKMVMAFFSPSFQVISDFICWINVDKEIKYYYFRGMQGQFILIVPEKNMVIVKTGSYQNQPLDSKGRPKQADVIVRETLKMFP